MAGINMISGLPSMTPPTAGGAAAVGSPASDFGQAVKKAIDAVESQQQLSTQSVQDMLTGQSDDVLPVVSAMAKADLSFKLLIGVRNKVIEAYKQTMNMQM
jgi:flagellar hook-basal body complex protein FliE